MNPRIRLSEPTIGPPEIEAVARAVEAGNLTFGPDLPAFEAGLAAAVGADDAVAVATGTAGDAVSIEARPIWPPLRSQAPYRDAPVLGGSTAVTLAHHVLCLPCAAHLSVEQQDDVIDRVLTVLRSG